MKGMRNMEEKRNAYEIVGTNRVAIDRIKDELEKDGFIKEKAMETIKRISRKIEIEKQKLEATSSLSEKLQQSKMRILFLK